MQTRISEFMAVKTPSDHLLDEITESIPYHAKTVETCFELLKTRATGLTQDEVIARMNQYGKNEIDYSQFKSTRKIFLNQFKSLVIILLFIASLMSFVMNQYESGLAILIAMCINLALNMLSQVQGQRKIQEFESIKSTACTVKRGKSQMNVPSADLVPGDILVFNSGDLIPIDARLITSTELQVDESLVTGESVLVRKDAAAQLIPDQDITEQSNMIFAGCRVKTGKGEAVVTATGARTMMGSIARLSQLVQKRETSLTKGLNFMGSCLFGIVVLLTTLIVVIEAQRGEPLISLIQFGIILLVAAVPEILPALATFILNLGIKRLFESSVLVKNLQAMESIGNVSVVCTDKTGTLTENTLTVHKLYLPGLGDIPYNPRWKEAKEIPGPSVESLLRIARFNNSTVMDGIRGSVIGDPIDIALYRSSPPLLERGLNRLRDIPFDSETMRTATVLKSLQDGFIVSMIKGAPEAILSTCRYYMKPNGEVVPMQPFERNEFLLQNQDLALENALRVIGFAQKMMLSPDDDPYTDAVFIGWVCLIDPPKQGAMQAIRHCRDIGVRVVMITGDQKATATVTAKELGILLPDSEVWTRKDLDTGFNMVPKTVSVFARTKPEEKLAIVQSLQTSGEVVAMVGDGVNDTPALQKSDIAIAMGAHGTDAAKESADILLLNDRIEGIVEAIIESRIQTQNVKLCVKYLLSCNFAVVLFLTVCSLIGLDRQLPLNALQVLWLNIITVMIPTMTLAFKPGNMSLLKAPPPVSQQGPLAKDEYMLVGFWSFLIMASGLGVYLISHFLLKLPFEQTSTATFCTIAFAQTFNLINIHLVYSGGKIKALLKEIASIPVIWATTLMALILQVSVVYVPGLQSVFKTADLNGITWLLAIVVSFVMIFISLLMTEVDNE